MKYYYYHQESECYFTSDEPDDSDLVVELTEEEYKTMSENSNKNRTFNMPYTRNAAYDPVPGGSYPMIAVDLEFSDMKDQEKYPGGVSCKLDLCHMTEEFKDRKKTFNVSIHEKTSFAPRQMDIAVGNIDEDFEGDYTVNPMSWLNKPFMVDMTLDSEDKNGKPFTNKSGDPVQQNNITKVYPMP